jgi:hypothetical protein
LALTLALVGACAQVTIRSNRRSGDADPLESVLFVLVEGNGPAHYPGLLKRYLAAETGRRGIAARSLILTGVELDESATIVKKAKDVQGVVTIVPAGGTRGPMGNLVQVMYDVRALRIVETTPGGDDADDSATPTDGGAEVDASGAPVAATRGAKPRTPAKERREHEIVPIWRARVNASAGAQEDQLSKIASELVVRMIADHVLLGKPEE